MYRVSLVTPTNILSLYRWEDVGVTTISDTIVVLFGIIVMATIGITAVVCLVRSGDIASAVLVGITIAGGIAIICHAAMVQD